MRDFMKTLVLSVLVFTCALATPSLGQQKTFNWVPGNDETVSLDPGYYHAGPTFQPNARNRDVHIDIEAGQPVTVATVSAQQWNDAAQHPEVVRDLKYFCVQQHIVGSTYTCTPPPGFAVVVVVRDERASERGAFSGIGEVIARRDHGGKDDGRAVSEGIDAALNRRPRREFLSPNNVHLQYYAWSCTENCNLPDPPMPKLFDWVPSDSETVRLDPANYYTSRTYQNSPQGSNMQVDIVAQSPVTVAMVDPSAWNDATQRPNIARNMDNIAYQCVQQHQVRTTYTCHMGGFWPQALIIRDERGARHDDRDGDHGQGKGPAATPVAANVPRVFQPSVAGATLADGGANRLFASPNDVRIQYYSWQCVQACDQPDFGWVRQVKEKYELTKILKVYGGLAADHDGTSVSIKVKSPVPMAVAILPSPVAGQLYGKPEMLDSAVSGSSCQQRGVQSSTFQCNFNLADGPQSLVLVPEAGVEIPKHKKTEIEVQAYKCVDNCNNLPAK
jgi:hypothetical protein